MWNPTIALSAAIFGFANVANADVRESNIKTESTQKAGDLSLGCVPKAREFTVYFRSEQRETPFEAELDVRGFPAGFSKRTELQGNFTFIVDSIISNPAGQVLRGSLVDGRGWQYPGKFFVFPQEWSCRLLVKGN